MLVLKCLLGSIQGVIVGIIYYIIVGTIIWIVVGLIMWDHVWGATVAQWAALFIPVGIVQCGYAPITKEKERSKAAHQAVVAAEAKRKAKEVDRLQRHSEEQQAYYKQMIVCGENSIDLFESMPEHLSYAESRLNRAMNDFSDGAFAPFWDSIEKAAEELACFNKGTRDIIRNSSCYTELMSKYQDNPPQFPLSRESVTRLDVGEVTAERMKAIVRKAQCNFQFATIYEQRKTNKILVTGFKNLAEALDNMTWRIKDSINDLAASVDTMGSKLNESVRTIHSRMGDIAEMTSQHHNGLMDELSKGAIRERKALEMLDNIQRGRRPFP